MIFCSDSGSLETESQHGTWPIDGHLRPSLSSASSSPSTSTRTSSWTGTRRRTCTSISSTWPTTEGWSPWWPSAWRQAWWPLPGEGKSKALVSLLCSSLFLIKLAIRNKSTLSKLSLASSLFAWSEALVLWLCPLKCLVLHFMLRVAKENDCQYGRCHVSLQFQQKKLVEAIILSLLQFSEEAKVAIQEYKGGWHSEAFYCSLSAEPEFSPNMRLPFWPWVTLILSNTNCVLSVVIALGRHLLNSSRGELTEQESCARLLKCGSRFCGFQRRPRLKAAGPLSTNHQLLFRRSHSSILWSLGLAAQHSDHWATATGKSWMQ